MIQMRTATIALTVAVILAGTFAIAASGSDTSSTLWLVPYSFGPLLGTILLSSLLNGNRSQLLLAISSLCYGAWFAYAYIDALYVHPDPQSPILFLLIGIYYALPWIAIFWGSAFLLRSGRYISP